MKKGKVVAVILVAALCLLHLSCLDDDDIPFKPPLKKARVTIMLKGMDGDVQFMLPPGLYAFSAEGYADETGAHVTVICKDDEYYTVAEKELHFSLEDAGAEPGDEGSADEVWVTVVAGADADITLTFNWEAQVPDGWVLVGIEFGHSPNINSITIVPAEDWSAGRNIEIEVVATDPSGGGLIVTAEFTDLSDVPISTQQLLLVSGNTYQGSLMAPWDPGTCKLRIYAYGVVSDETTVIYRIVNIVS